MPLRAFSMVCDSWTWFACRSNCCASSAIVFSPLTAAIAALAMDACTSWNPFTCGTILFLSKAQVVLGLHEIQFFGYFEP